VPELPDVETYLACLRPRIVGRTLEKARILSPFLLRTFDPPIESAEGRPVAAVSRLGKRIVLELDPDLFLVIHLMIAGRFQWRDDPAAKPPGRITLATFAFPTGLLILTEAGTKKRASLHLLRGREALAAHHQPGLDLLTCGAAALAEALRRENHTLKRALTDPRLIDGVGNAYADEILHAAGLSPVRLTRALTDEEIARLHAAARRTLEHWRDTLIARFSKRFPGPGDITAFRPEFAAHGRFGQPCPACSAPIQRIIHAENETNYCPRCQTGGKVLADRSLSRLLNEDWPRTLEELEQGPASR